MSEGDFETTGLQRGKTQLSRAATKNNQEFVWMDNDLSKSNTTSKWLPLISIIIIPLCLVPLFIGNIISAIDVFETGNDIPIGPSDVIGPDRSILSQELKRWGLFLTISYCVFLLSLICLHLIPYFTFKVFLRCSKKHSEGFKDRYENIKSLRSYIIRVLVSIGMLVTFQILWSPDRTKGRPVPEYVTVLYRLLKALVFFTICRLLVRCLMFFLYLHLKTKTYKNRIEDSQYAIDILNHLETEVDKAKKWQHTQNRVVTEGNRIIQFMKGDSEQMDITSDMHAKRLAKKLFTRISRDNDRIYPNDFYPFFSDAELASDAFYLFDKDQNGDISKSEMKRAVLDIYQERRYMMSSFKDINDVVKKLDRILLVVVVLLSVVYGALQFGENILDAAVPLLSGALAVSFMFADTAKDFFNSLLFLFANHPFDTGDIIVVEDVYYRVLEMSLMYSILEQLDGAETYVSNAILSQSYIQNLRRSAPQGEIIKVPLKLNTKMAQLDVLEDKVNSFLTSMPRDFLGPTTVQLRDIDKQYKMNTMKIAMWISYKRNFSDVTTRYKLRNDLMRCILTSLDECGIELVAE